MPLLFLLGALTIIWTRTSSLSSLAQLRYAISVPRFQVGCALSGIYVLTLFNELPAIIRHKGSSVCAYLQSLWLRTVVALYTLVPVSCAVLRGVASREPQFVPTGSNRRRHGAGRRHRQYLLSMVLMSILLGAGILRNPVVVILNWFWVLPVLSAPAFAYLLGRLAGNETRSCHE